MNQYTDQNKTYYVFLELAIVIGVLYMFGITDYLHAPWLTLHISNLIGTMFLMLIIVGPISFRAPASHTKRIYLAAGIMNIRFTPERC